MRRVEPIQVGQVVSAMFGGAILFASLGWGAALLLGAPLGFIAGLAMALRYC